MDANKEPNNRKKIADILDKPLAPTMRKLAVGMTIAHNLKEAAEDAGTTYHYAHKAGENKAVTGVSAAQLVRNNEKLDKMLTMLEDMIDKDAETPLKHSDKIAAVKLYAEITGAIGKKEGDTYNVGVFDLREATEEQLVNELARIEKQKRNYIDATVIDVGDGSTM